MSTATAIDADVDIEKMSISDLIAELKVARQVIADIQVGRLLTDGTNDWSYTCPACKKTEGRHIHACSLMAYDALRKRQQAQEKA